MSDKDKDKAMNVAKQITKITGMALFTVALFPLVALMWTCKIMSEQAESRKSAMIKSAAEPTRVNLQFGPMLSLTGDSHFA